MADCLLNPSKVIAFSNGFTWISVQLLGPVPEEWEEYYVIGGVLLDRQITWVVFR